MKFFVKALWLIAALTLSSAAYAVGMGGINVTTSLGEPLNAEIELVAVNNADNNKMSVRLASPDAFKAAGLDYPGALPKLTFQISSRANGEPYIKVTTAQPVNEPFVSLLVEMTWPSGHLSREFTFLLDPPGFKSEQPKVAEVQPVLSKVGEPLETGTPAAGGSKGIEPNAEAVKEIPAEMIAAAPVDEKPIEKPVEKPVEKSPVLSDVAPAKKPAESANVASGAIKVKHGDTLSKIAREAKSPDVSLERMLVAMYRANEDEFDGKNMNRLRTGKILRVPEAGDLNKVGQVDAVDEIHTQAADWHAYRLKLAAASNHVAEQAPKQEVSGKISTTVADKTPAAKETAKEVVRLSKGEAPGDKAAAAGKEGAWQDKLHAMEEDAIARNKALKESNERIALLEKNIKEMQRLLELKGQPVPPVPSAGVTVTPLPPIQPASAVTPAKPAAPKIETPPPSLLNEILAEPLYLAGAAAALLGLGGFGIMLSRRRAGNENKEKGSGSFTHITEPVAPSPDTGDFTQIATATDTPAQEKSEDIDPIKEADLFLNFGRDKQAEEILQEALKKAPDNQQIRLKLLSIYASRKDTKTFADVASQVQDSGNASAWEQAAEMGRKLDPGNPIYGGEGNAVVVSTEPPEEDAAPQPAASLDFDLGHDAPETVPAKVDVPLETNADETELDLDIGSWDSAVAEHATSAATSTQQDEKEEAAPGLDFELGTKLPESIAPSAPADKSSMEKSPPQNEAVSAQQFEHTGDQAGKNALNPDDLVFDVPEQSLPAAMTEEKTAKETPSEAIDDLAFTLDLPADEGKPETDNQVAEATAVTKGPDTVDLSEINLNLDTPVSAPAEEVKDAHWHDVATKLDLARAYQEMGDDSGAREILEEVLKEGDAQQRAAAEVMMQQLSA